MNKHIIKIFSLIFLWTAALCMAEPKEESQKSEKSDVLDVNSVLEKLNTKTLELVSFEGQIEYKFTQPALFDSQTLKKGQMYYQKKDKKTSLRINFQTLSQDKQEEQKYIEQYIVLDGAAISDKNNKFKGTWLVYIDYQTEELKYFQLAEPNDSNEPVDVFDLIGRNMPIVGFTRPKELKKQFDVNIVTPKISELENSIQVHLKVKPNSEYKDNYSYIDFWIDKTLYLPVKIIAVTTEEDIYEIKIIKPKINSAIAAKVFDFSVPKGFKPEITPLKEKNK
jgi:hypothetical protein